MPISKQVSLPELTPERLLDRFAEAIQVAMVPAKLGQFPEWTQRVMRILKEQFIPREYTSILSQDASVFAEGIAVAWAAKAGDLARNQPGDGGSEFARELAHRLGFDPKTEQVAVEVGTGTFTHSPEFQQHVINRLFKSGFSERRAFIEGMAIGNRLPELLDRQAKSSTTDATRIYLLLWFYWPEISRLNSVPQVARALGSFFAENKNLAGADWDERIRKLSNRIGLSFRAKQLRLKGRSSPRAKKRA